MSRKTQCQKVLNHLKAGRSITQNQALSWWNVKRLASRINDLRNQGNEIISTRYTKAGDVRYSWLGK